MWLIPDTNDVRRPQEIKCESVGEKEKKRRNFVDVLSASLYV